MTLSADYEPIVIPMEDPPAPPPIPAGVRLGRLLLRVWPFLAWCGAIAGAAALYVGEAGHGHALAFDEAQEIRVSPAIAGRIESLRVETGQKVRRGDLVATLDARDVEARLRLATTLFERARTRVAAEREVLRLEVQGRRSQALSRRNAYEKEGRRLRGEIDALTTAQAADEAEIGALQPQMDRLRPLLDRRLITADRMEELTQRRSVAQQRIASRTAEIRSAREELAAWAKLEPEELTDAAVEARLLPLELELKTQEARVAELELELGKCRVTAPIEGTVGRVSARAGEWGDAGTEIVQIVAPRPDRLTAYVVDRQIPAVAVGTTATLRPRDRGGPPLRGKVVGVGPIIEELPLRLRTIATIPQWGRRITMEVEKSGDPLPGEIYEVRFD